MWQKEVIQPLPPWVSVKRVLKTEQKQAKKSLQLKTFVAEFIDWSGSGSKFYNPLNFGACSGLFHH